VTITFSSPSPPRRWYAALIGTYLTGVAGLALLVRRRDSTPTVEARDVIVLAAATNKLARLETQEKVTGPLRAPFTEPVEEPDGTRHEQPQRPGDPPGGRRARDLPVLLVGVDRHGPHRSPSLAPRPTRVTLSAFAAMTGNDLLQCCWARVEPS
jgi:hypothetical protein